MRPIQKPSVRTLGLCELHMFNWWQDGSTEYGLGADEVLKLRHALVVCLLQQVVNSEFSFHSVIWACRNATFNLCNNHSLLTWYNPHVIVGDIQVIQEWPVDEHTPPEQTELGYDCFCGQICSVCVWMFAYLHDVSELF